MATFAAIVMAAALGADPSAERQALKEFGDFMVGGVWTVDGRSFEVRYRWILDGAYLERWTKPGPGLEFVGGSELRIIGIDSETGRITQWCFYKSESYRLRMRKKKDGVWIMRAIGDDDRLGGPGSFQKVIRKGKDTFVLDGVATEIDPALQRPVVYTRVREDSARSN